MLAINYGNSNAMNNLGFYYKGQKNYENMMKYFQMAIDKNNCQAMYNLCCYYSKIKDHQNMIKYYLRTTSLRDFTPFSNTSIAHIKI